MTTQVWICGIPKNPAGEYYCIYCNFKSENIEMFATSMCWDCALSEEEEQVTYSFEDVKVGDEVTLETTFTISSKDEWEGAIYGKDLKGRKFPVTNNVGYYHGSGRHTFNIKHVKKAATIIEHMPPQLGDVWGDEKGAEYHVVKGSFGGNKITDLDGNVFDTNGLKSQTGIKLIHRKGNRP